MSDERIPVYRQNKELPHELDDDVLVIQIMSYVIKNDIKSDLDFLNTLLSDMRCGLHMDWYDMYFGDVVFRKFLTDCFVCHKHNKLAMFWNDRVFSKAWDGIWREIYGRY